MNILLLDIGGIFYKPQWRKMGIKEVSNKLNIDKNEFKKALDSLKNPFYTGKISEKEYWNEVLKMTKANSVNYSDMMRLYRNYVQPIKEAHKLLDKLASKYTLIALNNAPKEWMNYRVNTSNLEKYFKKFYTSGYIGYMKPDVNIYKIILESFDKDNIIYIDDNEKYIEVAKNKFNIKSKLYKNLDDLRQLVR